MMADKENSGVNPNVLIFSPPKTKSGGLGNANLVKKKGDVLPTLIAARFNGGIRIDFGHVDLGSFHSQQFRIDNPSTSKAIKISIHKEPANKGFDVMLGPKGQKEITISEKSCVTGVVTWSAEHNASLYEKVTLKMDEKLPLDITITGKAGTGKEDGKVVEKDFKSLVAIAKNKVPHAAHRKPTDGETGAKDFTLLGNEESWSRKQEGGFTEWLNHTFSSPRVTVEEEESSVPASGAELRVLYQKRRDAAVRKEASICFQSDEVKIPLFNVSNEVLADTISTRRDRDIHSDVGLQKGLFELIFSYELPYLKLALEVVFNEVIEVKGNHYHRVCQSGDKHWTKAIKLFIQKRVLDSEIIRSRWTAQKLMYEANKKEQKRQLCAHFVQKFFEVVLVLDVLRVKKFLNRPALFVAFSEYKSSRDVLHRFCMEYLSAQGNLVKTLQHHGYQVSFKQEFCDEYQYEVSQIAVDLRDGVRLAKLVDILSKDDDLCGQLRVPPNTLSQKRHNVSLVFDKLFGGDLEPGLSVNGIVEGNREETLLLLWKILYKFELRTLVEPEAVKQEAMRIRKAKKWRKSIHPSADAHKLAVTVALRDENDRIHYPSMQTEELTERSQSLEDALIGWIAAVGNQYGVEVDDLGDCLSDGRALCLLIHSYHPTIIPTMHIAKTTANLDEDASDAQIDRALQGESDNFHTLCKACRTIGGIPMMLSPFDSESPPEDRAMVIFLAYLFTRLIESSEQVRSAIRIQRLFRGLRGSKSVWEPAAEADAASDIEDASVFSSVAHSVVSNVVTDVGCTVVLSRDAAASIIQRKYLSYATRQKFLACHEQHRLQEMQKLQDQEAFAAALREQELELEAALEEQEREEVLRLEEEQFIMAEEQCLMAQEADLQRAVESERVMMQKHAKVQEQEQRQRIAFEADQRNIELMKNQIRVEVETEVRFQAEREVEAHRSALEVTAERVIAEVNQDVVERDSIIESERRARQEMEERLMSLERDTEDMRASRQEMEEKLAEHENLNEELLDQLDALQARESSAEDAKIDLENKIRVIEREKELYQEASSAENDRERTPKVVKVVDEEVMQKLALLEDERIEMETRRLEAEMKAEEQERARLVAEQRLLEIETATLLKQKQHDAAVCLQANWRCFVKVRVLQKAKFLTVQVQAAFRGSSTRALYSKQNGMAIKIQCVWRRYCARRVFLEKYAVFKVDRGVVRLQAVARSFLVRQKCSPELRGIYERVRKHTSSCLVSVEAALKAVNTLQHSKKMGDLTEAARALVELTRDSVGICSKLVQNDAPIVLFSLIQSCNRSAAHQELLKNCLSAVEHIAAKKSFGCQVAQVEESIEILLDILQLFRDKKEVFVSACNVLHACVRISSSARRECDTPDFRKRLDGIRLIMERKARLDSRLQSLKADGASSESGALESMDRLLLSISL